MQFERSIKSSAHHRRQSGRAVNKALAVACCHRGMRQLVIFAGLMLAVSAGFVRYADRVAPTQPAPAASAMNATALASNNSRSITVPRGRNGHFQVEGRIDGRRLEFVVDTGASQIALRESE